MNSINFDLNFALASNEYVIPSSTWTHTFALTHTQFNWIIMLRIKKRFVCVCVGGKFLADKWYEKSNQLMSSGKESIFDFIFGPCLSLWQHTINAPIDLFSGAAKTIDNVMNEHDCVCVGWLVPVGFFSFLHFFLLYKYIVLVSCHVSVANEHGHKKKIERRISIFFNLKTLLHWVYIIPWSNFWRCDSDTFIQSVLLDGQTEKKVICWQIKHLPEQTDSQEWN